MTKKRVDLVFGIYQKAFRKSETGENARISAEANSPVYTEFNQTLTADTKINEFCTLLQIDWSKMSKYEYNFGIFILIGEPWTEFGDGKKQSVR